MPWGQPCWPEPGEPQKPRSFHRAPSKSIIPLNSGSSFIRENTAPPPPRPPGCSDETSCAKGPAQQVLHKYCQFPSLKAHSDVSGTDRLLAGAPEPGLTLW